ncbi:MAG TPA: hypothetical protein VFC19_38145 [Candidatus Limnocylindrales bacterium]|nr:hypothetical protein [Candidatus Limnocylindrales bacterium]
MTRDKHRRSVTDRARRRAIRAHAATLGVPYSVAARLLTTQASPPTGEPDSHRAWLFAMRESRPFALRQRDTRLAAGLPLGRAAHLAERFPPGDGAVLAMLYALLQHESPAILPSAEQLAWVAELGEETAVDFVCADLDRAARSLLDLDPWQLCTKIEAVIVAGLTGTDRSKRDVAKALSPEFRTMIPRRSFEAARNLFDELLDSAVNA